ncbi:MAG: YdcF family protein [Parvularculaceae bacterium]|nr:YdcF family protein [Parvularculaceae bacterium]
MGRVLQILLALVLAWTIGFWFFLRELAHAPKAPQGLKADAVVVFTGQGGSRVSAAMNLFGAGAGERLLISGVNADITREELARLWPGEPAGFECCVDLGWEAQTTVGNAREVRNWAITHDFDSLILVTSDYHMPRALLETRGELPEASIAAYRVDSGYLRPNGLPADQNAARQLAVEYSKFLAAVVKSWAPV